MPWCPKCKNEYVNGIEKCADCDIELLDELGDVDDCIIVLHLNDEDTAIKFIKFLEFSKIQGATYSFEEETTTWIILSPSILVKDIQKLYLAFRSVEEETKEEQQAQESNEDKEIETPLATTATYTKKKDKYEDLKSSATTFLIFGALGIVFVILNVVGVLSILGTLISQLVMGALFIGFIYIGLNSHKHAKLVQNQVGEEDNLTLAITSWLKNNVSESVFDTIYDENLSEEINFFNKLEQMKEMISNQFGDLNESYLDQIVEEFYNDNFENK